MRASGRPRSAPSGSAGRSFRPGEAPGEKNSLRREALAAERTFAPVWTATRRASGHLRDLAPQPHPAKRARSRAALDAGEGRAGLGRVRRPVRGPTPAPRPSGRREPRRPAGGGGIRSARCVIPVEPRAASAALTREGRVRYHSKNESSPGSRHISVAAAPTTPANITANATRHSPPILPDRTSQRHGSSGAGDHHLMKRSALGRAARVRAMPPSAPATMMATASVMSAPLRTASKEAVRKSTGREHGPCRAADWPPFVEADGAPVNAACVRPIPWTPGAACVASVCPPHRSPPLSSRPTSPAAGDEGRWHRDPSTSRRRGWPWRDIGQARGSSCCSLRTVGSRGTNGLRARSFSMNLPR